MRVIIAIVVTLLIVSGVGYATYAFFSASATDNSIGGTSHEVDFSVTSHEVYKASSLIPVSEDTIDSALNNYLSVLELYGNDIDKMNQNLNGKEIRLGDIPFTQYL